MKMEVGRKKIYKIIHFPVAHDRVEAKETEKTEMYLDLGNDLRIQWGMSVKFIPLSPK